MAGAKPDHTHGQTRTTHAHSACTRTHSTHNTHTAHRTCALGVLSGNERLLSSLDSVRAVRRSAPHSPAPACVCVCECEKHRNGEQEDVTDQVACEVLFRIKRHSTGWQWAGEYMPLRLLVLHSAI